MSKLAFHPKCRPPSDACGPDAGGDDDGNLHPKAFMLTDQGRWKRDDGSPAAAFIGNLNGEDRVWVASCACHKSTEPMNCPRWKALTHAREKLDIESISVHERPRARR